VNTPATTFDPIPVDVIPLPADIASWAMAGKGGTVSNAIDAIAYSFTAHLHGATTHHLRWDAVLHETLWVWRTFATNYVAAHFADHYSNFWDGLTFDQLTSKDATQLLSAMIKLATKQLPHNASGTAATTTKETDMIAMKRDRERHPLDGDLTHDEIATHAKEAHGTTDQDVIDAVAWLATVDLLTGHHSLIPFHAVREDIADMLSKAFQKLDKDQYGMLWDWEMLAHTAVLAADENLFSGSLYAKAESDGTATARTRVGSFITELAAQRIWPHDTDPALRVNPDRMLRYSEVAFAHRRVMAEAFEFIDSITGNADKRRGEKVLDSLDDDQVKALLDHLAVTMSK
jgi:hypothetical protein